MIDLVPAHGGGVPKRWILAFSRVSKVWWVNRLVPGRYKHVMAMGYIAEVDLWVFFNVTLGYTEITAGKGRFAARLMAHYAADADLIGIPARQGTGFVPRAGFWCVPAVKHLVGLEGRALRPDALWRDCIRQGGEVLSDGCAELPAAAS